MPIINKHLHPWVFRKTKVFFHPFTGKHRTQREEELQPWHFHPSPSSQQHFGTPAPLCFTSRGTSLRTTLPAASLLGQMEEQKGSPAPPKAFACNATHLQLSISPQRGLQMLLSLPVSEASLLLALEKPSFLESSGFLLKIGIPAKEADPDQALPFGPDLHPSLGNPPSWKCLGYKYSPQNSLWHFSLYYRNFPLAGTLPRKATAEYKPGKASLCRGSRVGGSGRSALRPSPHTLAWTTSRGDVPDHHITYPKDLSPSPPLLVLSNLPSPHSPHLSCHPRFVSFTEATRRKLLTPLWYGENLINVSKRRKSSEKLPANLLSFNFLAITVSSVALSQ